MGGIEEALAAARARLVRATPAQAALLQETGALLVDIRPVANRVAEGGISGSIPVERIHLEWRLDPAGEHRLPQILGDSTVVIFCNEGYASSLAAAAMHDLGLPGATDLVGGFRAWRGAGLPVSGGKRARRRVLGPFRSTTC